MVEAGLDGGLLGRERGGFLRRVGFRRWLLPFLGCRHASRLQLLL
jgi:hypothetical protein